MRTFSFRTIIASFCILLQCVTYAQTLTKEEEEDGFVWYRVKEGELYGALDADKNVLLDTKFNHISYQYGYISKHAFPYFAVTYIDGVYEIYNKKGGCVVNRNNNYHYINVENLFYEYPYGYYLIVWDGNQHYGICDINGKVLLKPNYKFAKVRAMEGNGKYYYQYQLKELDGRSHYVDMQGNDWGDLHLFRSGGTLCLAKDMKKMTDLGSFPTTDPFATPGEIWKAGRKTYASTAAGAIPYSELNLNRMCGKHYKIVSYVQNDKKVYFKGDLSIEDKSVVIKIETTYAIVTFNYSVIEKRDDNDWIIIATNDENSIGNLMLMKKWTLDNPDMLCVGWYSDFRNNDPYLLFIENHQYDSDTMR